MTPRNRNLLALTGIGLMVAAWFGSSCGYRLRADASPRPRGKHEMLRLRTDPLPTPLVMEGDPLKRPVTSLEIRGEINPGGEGQGTVTFEESTHTFNAFGDATRVTSKAAKPRSVIFRPMKPGDAKEQRRVYEIVFADGSFPNRMRLILSAGTTGPHCLLILGGNKPVQEEGRPVAHLLELHGLPKIKASLPDAPLRSPFHLTTLSYDPASPNGKLHRLTIRGTPNGPGSLHLDYNTLMFNGFGDVVGSTLVGYFPIKATLKRKDLPDPAQQGRRLFEIVPEGKPRTIRYFLVLAPTEAGAHRMLLWEGNTLRRVLPLHDPDRRYHMRLQPEIATTAPKEQQAVKELRKILGYRFRFHVESGAIITLLIENGEDAERVDAVLKDLPNLKTLGFSGSRLGAAGLTSLRYLTRLETLRIEHAPVADGGLANVKYLNRLRYLSFYGCTGITDAGLAHLQGLKNLTYLWLSREDFAKSGQPNAPRITDAGLKYLQDLKNLKVVEVMGQAITDAGLERLKGLSNLERLFLSGEGITDAGLAHLSGLSHLEYLNLYETRVSPAGEAELKARLPRLEIGH